MLTEFVVSEYFAFHTENQNDQYLYIYIFQKYVCVGIENCYKN